MTLLQRIAELERWRRNVFAEGVVAEAGEGQARVDIGTKPAELITDWLPLLTRDQVTVNEPVLLILPQGDPAAGYVLPLAGDQQLGELAEQIDTLQKQLAQLQQQMSSGNAG